MNFLLGSTLVHVLTSVACLLLGNLISPLLCWTRLCSFVYPVGWGRLIFTKAHIGLYLPDSVAPSFNLYTVTMVLYLTTVFHWTLTEQGRLRTERTLSTLTDRSTSDLERSYKIWGRTLFLPLRYQQNYCSHIAIFPYSVALIMHSSILLLILDV